MPDERSQEERDALMAQYESILGEATTPESQLFREALADRGCTLYFDTTPVIGFATPEDPELMQDAPLRRALRALQIADEAIPLNLVERWQLVAMMTKLGEELGLECTGAVDGTNADGTVAFYDHSGDTCPIHEWLVESDGDHQAE